MTTRDIGEPLAADNDNVHMWRLGECATKTMKQPGGDLIDTGLILLRLLNEQGYDVVPNRKCVIV